MIEQAPMQTYGAALILSPTKSEVKTRFWHERLAFIDGIQGTKDNWDPCLQTIESSGITKMVFSPDGRVLALFSIASYENEAVILELYDAFTGTCTHTLENGDALKGQDPTPVQSLGLC